MNAFRALFLLVVLASGLAVAMARLVPGAVADQSRSALAERARLESLLVGAAEDHAALVRQHAGSRLAADPSLRAALAASTAPVPADGAPAAGPADVAPPVAPAAPAMFRQALNGAAVELEPFDAVLLVGADGGVVDARSRVDGVDAGTLATRARADLPMETASAVETWFGALGRLFVATALPILSDAGAPVGAIVVVDEYDDAVVATRRSAADAYVTYFVGFDVVGSNVSDPSVEGLIADVVSRTSSSTVGAPGRLLLQEFRDVDDRTVLLAPVRLPDPETELAAGAPPIGAVVAVQAPAIATTLPAMLAQMRAFDEGIGALWVPLGVSLLIFLAGLALLDASTSRATGAIAKHIRDNATENDPSPIPPGNFRPWVRPVAEAYNVFLETYRTQTPMARRARHDSAVAMLPGDASGASSPAIRLSTLDSATGRHRRVEAALASGASTAVFDESDASASSPDQSPPIFRIDTGQPAAVDDARAAAGAAAGAARDGAPLAGIRGPETPRPPEQSDDMDPFAGFGLDAVAAAAEPSQVAVDVNVAGIKRVDSAGYSAVPASRPAPGSTTEESGASQRSKRAKHPGNLAELLASLGGPKVGEPLPQRQDADPTGSGASRRFERSDEAIPAFEPEEVDIPSVDSTEATGTEAEEALGFATSGEGDGAGEPFAPAVEEDTEPDPFASPDAAVAPAYEFMETAASTSAPYERVEASDAIPFEAFEAVEAEALSFEGFEPVGAATGAERAVAPPPVPAITESELEGVHEGPAEPFEPQADATVPRVSVEDLARRAAEARRAAAGDQEALLSAAEARIRRLKPDAPPPAAASEEHRSLYDEFVAAKRSCGEDVSKLTYERFVEKLARNRAALTARYNCSDVRFQVSVHDDKVTLKATPIR